MGKALHSLGKALDSLFRVSVLNAVPDAVLDVPLQNDFSASVQSGFCGIDLGENILAGHVFVHHPVNGLYLSDDFFQPAVQVFCIHTLFHVQVLHTIRGMCLLYPGGSLLSTNGKFFA